MTKYLSEYKIYMTTVLGLEPNTRAGYERDIARYLAYLEKERRRSFPEAITAEDIRAFIAREKRQRLSAKSLARRLSSIRSFHRFLLTEKYVDRDVSKLIDGPKQEKRLPLFLTTDEVDRLWRLKRGQPDRDPEQDDDRTGLRHRLARKRTDKSEDGGSTADGWFDPDPR